jgi:hypothetical protein
MDLSVCIMLETCLDSYNALCISLTSMLMLYAQINIHLNFMIMFLTQYSHKTQVFLRVIFTIAYHTISILNPVNIIESN